MDINQLTQLVGSLAQNQADLQKALTELVTTVNTLSNKVPTSTSSGSPSRSVQKPSSYDGKSSQDARRFIAAFSVYGMMAGDLNERQGDVFIDTKWIMAALTFLRDDAAIWATPYLEALALGQAAFTNWDAFKTAFKVRFETVNEAADAKEALRKLWQGKLTAGEYAAKFKELMSRTGYSATDLRDRFYDHLSTDVKDDLVHTERKTTTLDDLITVALDIDTRIRNRRAEKAREQGRPAPAPIARAPVPVTPFDPNAMQIDATQTREAFLQRMTGRCFGCGSTSHQKRSGTCPHGNSLCGWCGRNGHTEMVCQDKFMGKEKGTARKQAVRVTEVVEAAAPVTQTQEQRDAFEAQMAALRDAQENFAKQLAALKSGF